MSDYDFLDFEPGWRQVDGFFVDKDRSILFWPTKRAPGFVVPAPVARQIAEDGFMPVPPPRIRWVHATLKPLLGIAYLFAIIVGLGAFGLLVEFLAPLASDYISEPTVGLGAMYTAMFLYLRYFGDLIYLLSLPRMKRLTERLRAAGFKQIDQVRPEPTRLKPSATLYPYASLEERASFRRALTVIGVIMALSGLFLIAIGKPVGDYVVGLLISANGAYWIKRLRDCEVNQPGAEVLTALSITQGWEPGALARSHYRGVLRVALPISITVLCVCVVLLLGMGTISAISLVFWQEFGLSDPATR